MKLVRFALGLSMIACGTGCNGNKPANAPERTTTPVTPTPAAGTTSKSVLDSCSASDAEDVLKSIAVMADVSERKNETVYTFRDDWWATVEPKKEEMMTAAANADACEHKVARRIVFRNPHKVQIGIADPIKGLNFPGS